MKIETDGLGRPADNYAHHALYAGYESKSFFTSLAVGYTILKILVEWVIRFGGTEEHLWKLARNTALQQKIGQLIASIPSLSYLIEAAKFDQVHCDITESDFPVELCEPVDLDQATLHRFEGDNEWDVRKCLKDLGKRPATMAELLVFAAVYPERQREIPIVALGSGALYYSQYRVPFIGVYWKDESLRCLSLVDERRGFNHKEYLFLAFPLAENQ